MTVVSAGCLDNPLSGSMDFRGVVLLEGLSKKKRRGGGGKINVEKKLGLTKEKEKSILMT